MKKKKIVCLFLLLFLFSFFLHAMLAVFQMLNLHDERKSDFFVGANRTYQP